MKMRREQHQSSDKRQIQDEKIDSYLNFSMENDFKPIE
jgi:hypothetical protein